MNIRYPNIRPSRHENPSGRLIIGGNRVSDESETFFLVGIALRVSRAFAHQFQPQVGFLSIA